MQDITFDLEWKEALGFGIGVKEDDPSDPQVTFSTRKYTLSLVERFLKGESKPERATASRQSIMSVAAEKLLPVGSPEDLEISPVARVKRKGVSTRDGRSDT